MARKKVIKKRTRAGGELAARATALLDEVWAEHVEAEEQRDLGRVKRTIWASEAEYAAIRAYLEPPREAAGSAPAGPAGQRLEAVLQAELAAARHREQQRARRERWREPEAARPERRP